MHELWVRQLDVKKLSGRLLFLLNLLLEDTFYLDSSETMFSFFSYGLSAATLLAICKHSRVCITYQALHEPTGHSGTLRVLFQFKSLP